MNSGISISKAFVRIFLIVPSFSPHYFHFSWVFLLFGFPSHPSLPCCARAWRSATWTARRKRTSWFGRWDDWDDWDGDGFSRPGGFLSHLGSPFHNPWIGFSMVLIGLVWGNIVIFITESPHDQKMMGKYQWSPVFSQPIHWYKPSPHMKHLPWMGLKRWNTSVVWSRNRWIFSMEIPLRTPYGFLGGVEYWEGMKNGSGWQWWIVRLVNGTLILGKLHMGELWQSAMGKWINMVHLVPFLEDWSL